MFGNPNTTLLVRTGKMKIFFDIFTRDNKSNPKREGVAAPMKISQQIQIIKAILAPLSRVENGAEMVMF